MNNVESKGVIVEQDVNTLIEEIQQHRFTSEEIKTYFKIAAAEAEANLQVYFPEDI
ncbi:hypothetical protein NIES4106_13040 [Fischerella sp. NIES-4106]|nr:hypothetical protein NIES4106_13040 [Fischerella sp. NIES-4106]